MERDLVELIEYGEDEPDCDDERVRRDLIDACQRNGHGTWILRKRCLGARLAGQRLLDREQWQRDR